MKGFFVLKNPFNLDRILTRDFKMNGKNRIRIGRKNLCLRKKEEC